MSQGCSFRAHQQWSSSFCGGGLVSQLSKRETIDGFEVSICRDSIRAVLAGIAEAGETISCRVDHCYGSFIRGIYYCVVFPFGTREFAKHGIFPSEYDAMKQIKALIREGSVAGRVGISSVSGSYVQSA